MTRARRKRLAVDPALARQLWQTMVLIRQVEMTLSRLFADGEVPGFIHLSVGQEAISAGIAAAMGASDTLATTHRGHGHVLARGADLTGFFGEVLGRANGLCQGRGGSMHVAELARGILGANGIVAAGVPIALGSALAHQIRETGGVAVSFFGDGAMAEGVLHETLNMAALWRVPLLLVCENNGWSEFSPTEKQFAARLAALASAFAIDYQEVDGNDAVAVAAAAQDAMRALRSGRGPRVIECRTRRGRGHYEGDPQKYRTDLAADEDGPQDPIANLQAKLVQSGVSEADLHDEQNAIEQRIQAAVAAARAAPLPDFEAARHDVYTPGAAV